MDSTRVARRLIVALATLAAFSACGFSRSTRAAEVAKDSPLRRGRVLSEPAAELRLEAMKKEIPDGTAWKHRARLIRANILRGTQLEKLPPPSPLNAVVHSQKNLDGCSVANVAFEALPGFFVTGNLYLPAKPGHSMPGILLAHGHLENGRCHESTQVLASSLARMGAAVFAWDMLGFGESTQCEHKHPQALRLQTYSSMRALDFLTAQAGVDEKRLAITGASGGGTQTFILAAVDDRIDVAAPVVQVSAHFYGGCVCESGMPIHVHDDFETNNVEIAAAFAPKPLLLVSDGRDWTANTPSVEFPYIQRIYGLLAAKDRVENAHFADEGHDYGPSKRAAVYRFFAKQLQLNLAVIQNSSGAIDESFVTVLDYDQLAAFDDAHPRPAHACQNGDEIVKQLDRAQ
jgi:dienelactone hydrolase